jgi:phage protein U
MFALLGEIPFEVIGSPETLESLRTYEYAEHKVVEGRPRLQWVADGLEMITLQMLFHASFTNPALQLGLLQAAAADHGASPLLFGNGVHRGYFIVISFETASKQLSQAGDPIAILARVNLKEWPLGAELDPSAPPRPTTPPLGIVIAQPGAATGTIPYSAPQAITSTVTPPSAVYLPPALAAPGVSPILNNPALAGTTSPALLPNDVPTGWIVRAAQ